MSSERKDIGCTLVYVLIVLGVIVSCLLIGFGVLMVVGSTDRTTPGAADWLPIGVGLIIVGLILAGLAVGVFVFLRIRQTKEAKQTQEIVQKIDFSGEVGLAKLKCRECGGELNKDNVSVQAGAVFVSCPYCGAAYQIVEEPKW